MNPIRVILPPEVSAQLAPAGEFFAVVGAGFLSGRPVAACAAFGPL